MTPDLGKQNHLLAHTRTQTNFLATKYLFMIVNGNFSGKLTAGESLDSVLQYIEKYQSRPCDNFLALCYATKTTKQQRRQCDKDDNATKTTTRQKRQSDKADNATVYKGFCDSLRNEKCSPSNSKWS